MANIVETVLDVSGPSGYDHNGSDFDLLRDAVLTAGLADALSDPDANLTVFAPQDSAFVGLAQTLGYSGSDEAGSLGHIVDALTLLGAGDPIPLLQQVLTYHVVDGKFFKDDVVALGDGAKIQTLEGGKVTLDLSVPGLEDLDPGLPDPALIGFDVDTDNGVIHVLDGVLLPLPVSAVLSQEGTDFIIGDDDGDFYFTHGGNDFVDGNGGRDFIRTGSGDDIAIGGSGNDGISGASGNDTLLGESGRDKIYGGSGHDTIVGGSGDDWLGGGTGRDTFVFENGSHEDKILDFRNGQDKIDLSGYEGIHGFDDIAHDIRGRYYGSKIELEGDDEIHVVGVRASHLDESDFLFA